MKVIDIKKKEAKRPREVARKGKEIVTEAEASSDTKDKDYLVEGE